MGLSKIGEGYYTHPNTGKQHDHVLRDCDKLNESYNNLGLAEISAWVKVNGGNFSLVEYIDKKGEKRPCWMAENSKYKGFLGVLSKGRNLPLTDLVQVTKGGNEAGTWMHKHTEYSRIFGATQTH